MRVANAYGMIQPGASDTSAVRATFFIDPESILRAMVYYPMSNGRCIAEFLCLLQAMQASDKNGIATPEDWHPGDDAVVPPPKTYAVAKARKGEGYTYTDWYFSTKPIAGRCRAFVDEKGGMVEPSPPFHCARYRDWS